MVLNTVSDALSSQAALDTDVEMICDLLASWSACYAAMPGVLSVSARDNMLKAIEHQVTRLRETAQNRGGEEALDEDDLLELMELVEDEAELWVILNATLREIMKNDGEAFPVAMFAPFLALIDGPKTTKAPSEFALRLLSDLLHNCGAPGASTVQPYMSQVLAAVGDAGE